MIIEIKIILQVQYFFKINLIKCPDKLVLTHIYSTYKRLYNQIYQFKYFHLNIYKY